MFLKCFYPNNAEEILLNPALIGDQNIVMPQQYHVASLHNPLMHDNVPYDIASGSNMGPYVPYQRIHGVVDDHRQQFMRPHHIHLLTHVVMRNEPLWTTCGVCSSLMVSLFSTIF